MANGEVDDPMGIPCCLGAWGRKCGYVDGRNCFDTQCPADMPETTTQSVPYFCWDSRRDRHNCGGCGVNCAATETCEDGACTAFCPAGQTVCFDDRAASDYNPGCFDLKNDPAHCGSCGATCQADQDCHQGDCVARGAPLPPRVTALTTHTYSATLEPGLPLVIWGEHFTPGQNTVHVTAAIGENGWFKYWTLPQDDAQFFWNGNETQINTILPADSGWHVGAQFFVTIDGPLGSSASWIGTVGAH
jgi:hypothetical protein